MSHIFKGQGYTLEYFGPEEYAKNVGWKTAGSAGFDLVYLDRLERKQKPFGCLAPTGVRILECAPNLVGLLFLRSSSSLNHGLRLVNAVGVIDSDYRDEIHLTLKAYPAPEVAGTAVAQLVFVPFAGPLAAPETQRVGGIGSTDK